MIFGFGKDKNTKKAKISYTSEGDHGYHWLGIFGLDSQMGAEEFHKWLSNIWHEMEILQEIDSMYSKFGLEQEPFSILGIMEFEKMRTLFPALHSTKSIPLDILRIVEWDHVEGIEGQIDGFYGGSMSISFFATDYLENKKKYRAGGVQNISLSGVAYSIDSQANLPDNFSPDFTSFIQKSNPNDEYDFTSNISSISDIDFKGEKLKYLVIQLYHSGEDTAPVYLPVITNAKNILCNNLNVGDKISGSLWMQGKISD